MCIQAEGKRDDSFCLCTGSCAACGDGKNNDRDAFDLFVYDGTGTDSQRILFTDPFPADPEDQQKDGRISRK